MARTSQRSSTPTRRSEGAGNPFFNILFNCVYLPRPPKPTKSSSSSSASLRGGGASPPGARPWTPSPPDTPPAPRRRAPFRVFPRDKPSRKIFHSSYSVIATPSTSSKRACCSGYGIDASITGSVAAFWAFTLFGWRT
jgi:hypothetical protein